MQSAVLRTCAAILLASLFSLSSETQNERPSGERVWFALEEHPRGQLRMEPIAVVSDGELTRVPSACSEENSEYQQFISSYLQPGQAYPVTFGGAAAGEVKVGNNRPNSVAATVTYEGPLKIQGRVRALATNQNSSEFRVESRQTATREERANALALAREIFQQHGISQGNLSQLRLDFLTRTVLAPSPTVTWIASFTLETSGRESLQHNLFFIANQESGTLQPELLWIRLSENFAEDETAELVDHADLLGDGRDEVVVKLGSTENHRYVIYRKRRDGQHWEQILMSDLLECP
jgi:hypothetical protein